MGSITSYCRKALVTIVSLSFIFNIQSANASTLAGGSGWRVASTVANGVGVTVNGVKDIIVNGASKTVSGVANVTPTAGQVGKFMGKNLGAAAVVAAMDLLLDGVDYVMDPANNSVQYKTKSDPNNKPMCYSNIGVSSTCFGSMAAAAAAAFAYDKSQYPSYEVVSYTIKNKTVYTKNKQGEIKNIYTFGYVANPNYDAEAASQENQSKTIPLVNLGSQVINQAQEEVRTGNPAVPIATPVTQAAATAVIGEAATDEAQARPIAAELDKSAAIPTDQTAVGEIAPPTTNPDTGEVKPGSISLDFPVFCSWAPSLCVMADKVQQAISDVATEYADKPQENTNTELEIPDLEEQSIDSDISFGGSCPAPLTSQVNFMGINETIEFSFDPVCEIAEFIKPVVISISAFSAALIVAGIRTEDD